MAPSVPATEYQALVEQAPIMIWRANTTSEYDYFNDSLDALRRVERDNLASQNN